MKTQPMCYPLDRRRLCLCFPSLPLQAAMPWPYLAALHTRMLVWAATHMLM